MYVKKINEVKELLDQLKDKALVSKWELPYENLLTRLNAAIFFLEPSTDDEQNTSAIWDALSQYEDFSYRVNEEKTLSKLLYRITFSSTEKSKNLQLAGSKNEINGH